MKFFLGIFTNRQSFRLLVVLFLAFMLNQGTSSALSSAENAKIALASGGEGRTESKAWKSTLGGIRAKLDAIKAAKSSAAGLDAASAQADAAIKQLEVDIDADGASADVAKQDDAKKLDSDTAKPVAPTVAVKTAVAQSPSADKAPVTVPVPAPAPAPVPVKKDEKLSDNNDGGNTRLQAKINILAQRAVRKALDEALGSMDLRALGQMQAVGQQGNVDTKAIVAQVVQQVTPVVGQAIAAEIGSSGVGGSAKALVSDASQASVPLTARTQSALPMTASTAASLVKQEDVRVLSPTQTSTNAAISNAVLQGSGAVPLVEKIALPSKTAQAVSLATSSIDKSTPVVVPANFVKIGDVDLTKVAAGLVDGQLSIWGIDSDAKLYKSIRDKNNSYSFILADPVSTKGESLVGITDVAMATDGTLYLAANNKIYAYHHANMPAPRLPTGSKNNDKQHKTTTPYVWEEMLLGGDNQPVLRAVSVGGRNNIIAWNPGKNNLYRLTHDGASVISKKNCVFALAGNDGAVYLIGDDGVVNVLSNDEWRVISGIRKYRCVAGGKNNLWGILDEPGDGALELGRFNKNRFEPLYSASGAIARGFISVDVAGDNVVLLDKNGIVYKSEKGMGKQRDKKGSNSWTATDTKPGVAGQGHDQHVSDKRAGQDADSDEPRQGRSQKKGRKAGKNGQGGDKFATRFGAIRDNLTNIENRDVIRRAVNAVLDALDEADGKLLPTKDQDTLVSNMHLLVSDKVKSQRMTRYVSALVRLVLREKVLDDTHTADAQKMVVPAK